MAKKIDGALLKEMFSSGATLLAQNREAVDALNVFPVPDGDTGTNMTQTITSAIREMNAKYTTSAGDVADAVARGALKGARGNSGVILSQILRGFSKAVSGHDEIDKDMLVAMLRSGAKTAYKAVMKPKEGTILTVIRVIADEVEAETDSLKTVEDVFAKVLLSGEQILRRTPDMLPVLKQAGVVDSGGQGLMIVFRGMNAALTGEPLNVPATEEAAKTEEALPGEFVDDHTRLEDIKFGYCTEFIVSHPRPDMRESDPVKLRERLERIGDCVIVVSDLNVVKVHVHTNDPGKAIQYALELGELDSIKIDNMFEEAREREAKRLAAEAAKAAEEAAKAAAAEAELVEYGIVAVALGDGLVSIFKDLNIEQVVDGGQTMNPSIEDLAEAAKATHARNIFILPNNTNIILAAQQAKALLEDRNVIVLPTKSVPMGISAALAFNGDNGVEDNEAAMAAAADAVHTASVTYAVRDTNYDGREIHAGDIMGMIDNRLSVLGNDASQAALECTEKMVDEESSLITVYYGADVDEETANALGERLEKEFPDCDVAVQYGGQPLYYYLVSVE